MTKLSSAFISLLTLVLVTLVIFAAIAMPPGAWGIIGVTIVAGFFVVVVLLIIGWLFVQSLRSNERTVQMVAGFAYKAQEDNRQITELNTGLAHHALEAGTSKVAPAAQAKIIKSLEDGTRIYREGRRYILAVPGRGEFDAVRDAGMTQAQIDFMAQEQQYYIDQ